MNTAFFRWTAGKFAAIEAITFSRNDATMTANRTLRRRWRSS